jgi:hypothetical protein
MRPSAACEESAKQNKINYQKKQHYWAKHLLLAPF